MWCSHHIILPLSALQIPVINLQHFECQAYLHTANFYLFILLPLHTHQVKMRKKKKDEL